LPVVGAYWGLLHIGATRRAVSVNDAPPSTEQRNIKPQDLHLTYIVSVHAHPCGSLTQIFLENHPKAPSAVGLEGESLVFHSRARPSRGPEKATPEIDNVDT